MKTTRLFIVLFLLLSTRGFAQTGLWTDEGNYDVSWYNDTDTEFTITTAAQLAGLAKLANDGTLWLRTLTYKLGNDIDLEGHYWTPIGTRSKPISLNFDGQNHKICNMVLDMNMDGVNYFGLFGYANFFMVKNVIIDETCRVVKSEVAEGKYLGGISGYVCGPCNIENCVNNASFTVQDNCGGIIGADGSGNDESIIKGCVNNGNIIGGEPIELYLISLGGIIAVSNGTSNIEDCTNNGNITSTGLNCGGILGSGDASYITNCTNYGTINTQAEDGDLIYFTGGTGGIIGHLNSFLSVSSCINKGNVSGRTVGGIVGMADDSYLSYYKEIANCINYGTITKVKCERYYRDCAGGILGTNDGLGIFHIINCLNTGSVNASGTAAGIAAQALVIDNCRNTGTVYATSSERPYDDAASGACAYGISGICNGIVNCGNEGDVSAHATLPRTSVVACGIGNCNTIINCYNRGNISTTGGGDSWSVYIAGISGSYTGCRIVNYCYNTGDISASGYDFEKGAQIGAISCYECFGHPSYCTCNIENCYFNNIGMTDRPNGSPAGYTSLSEIKSADFLEKLNNGNGNYETYFYETLYANLWTTDEATGLPVPFSTTPGTTGIKEISNDDTHNGVAPARNVISRYDMSGRKLNKTTRGLNIIKMSDGTVRKVFVK